MRLEHVALWVHDLERMRSFYVERLGGRSAERYHNPHTGFTSYFVSFDAGARVELMHGPDLVPRAGPAAAGYAHVAFALGGRAEVDALVERLRAQGVEVASAPRVTGDGYYEAVVLDPEGNRLELTA